MEVFRELFVYATASEVEQLAKDIERRLPEDWRRDRQAEEKMNGRGPGNCVTFAFRCDDAGERRAAMLVLMQKDEGTFYVSNIVPAILHQLSRNEYNAILEEFYTDYLQPCADALGFKYSVTEENYPLERWMDTETSKLLRAFSSRSYGASHPLDRERWNAFIVSAHRTNCGLNSSQLKQWLIEEGDWSPEVANELANEYESAREILAYAAST